VFLRDGERVLHAYSACQRGLDLFLNTYNFLGHTPLGRQEEDGILRWVRRLQPGCSYPRPRRS
jgi:predicted dithiol-disulfide oxidoreductase (DUF899 family)